MPFAPRSNDDGIRSLGVDSLETSIDGLIDRDKEAAEDLRYSWNDQWSSEGSAARKKLKRPMFTFNILDRLVNNMAGQYRASPIHMEARPVDSAGDRIQAALYQGILRAIQYNSRAALAYAWAGECAARTSVGYFRLDVDYEHDRCFDLAPSVGVLWDPWTVRPDPHAYTQDEWEWCHVLKAYTVDAYRAAYPGKELSDVGEVQSNRVLKHWYELSLKDALQVRRYIVSEFFWKEQTRETIGLLDGDTEATVLEEGQLYDEGGVRYYPKQDPAGFVSLFPVTKLRQVETHKVRKVVMAGHGLLSKPFDWYTKRIPIYEVRGVSIIGDGKQVVKSAIRNGRDSQTVVNSMWTSAAETTMAAAKNKWLAPMRAVQRYLSNYWSAAKLGDPAEPVLPYDPDPALPNGGKPEWSAMPSSIGAQMAQAGASLELVRYTTGIGEEGTGIKGNSSSGRQEALRQEEQDANTEIFRNNLIDAVHRCAEDTVEIIRELYAGQRPRIVEAVIEEEGLEPEFGHIGIGGAVAPDQMQSLGKLTGNAALSEMPDPMSVLLQPIRHNVRVSVGRSSATRRTAATEFAGELMRSGLPPEASTLVAGYFLEQSDMPGARQLAERLEQVQAGAMGGNAEELLAQMVQSPAFVQAVQAALGQLLGGPGGQPGDGAPFPEGSVQ